MFWACAVAPFSDAHALTICTVRYPAAVLRREPRVVFPSIGICLSLSWSDIESTHEFGEEISESSRCVSHDNAPSKMERNIDGRGSEKTTGGKSGICPRRAVFRPQHKRINTLKSWTIECVCPVRGDDGDVAEFGQGYQVASLLAAACFGS